MQTERVTFLTSRDQKAELDAFASSRGESVGNVLREAASRFIGQGEDDDYEEALALALPELEAIQPEIQANLEAIRKSIAEARASIAESLRRVEATR
jgi:hypothetical protein